MCKIVRRLGMAKLIYVQKGQKLFFPPSCEIPACRICLERNCKLYNFKEKQLETLYHEVTSIPLSEMQGIPCYICYMCRAVLLKTARFRERCRQVHNILRNSYLEGRMLTESYVDTLKNTLSFMTTINKGPVITCPCPDEESSTSIEEKIKVEPEEIDDVILLAIKQSQINLDEEPKTLEDFDVRNYDDNGFDNGDNSSDENDEPLAHLKEVLKEESKTGDGNERKRKALNDKNRIRKYKRCSRRRKFDRKNCEYMIPQISEECMYKEIFDKYVNEKYVQRLTKYYTTDENKHHSVISLDENEDKIPGCDENNEIFEEYPENKLKDAESDTDCKKEFKKYVRQKYFNVYDEEPEKETTKRRRQKPLKCQDEFAKAHNFEVKLLTLEEQKQELVARLRSKKNQMAVYTCELCYRGFQTDSVYQEHLVRHDKSYGQYECRVCHLRYSSQALVMKHYRNHRVKYECKQCGMVLRNTSGAKRHYNEHNGAQYVCEHCGKVFIRYKTRLEHYRIMHGSSSCDICYRCFTNPNAVTSHKTKLHRITFPCTKCKTVFDNEVALKAHSLAATGGDCGRYRPCCACGSNFLEEKLLNDHITEFHAKRSKFDLRSRKKERDVVGCCPCRCPNKANDSDRQNSKVNEHSDAGARNASDIINYEDGIDCKNKDTEISDTSNNAEAPPNSLNINQNGSENENETISSQKLDTKRINIGRPGRPRKRYTNECGCRCEESRCEALKKSYKQALMCEMCAATKPFCSITALREHQLIHTGEKPHKCTVCSKSFRLKYLLKIHMHIHSDARPYQCAACGKGFRTATGRNRHNLTHTGERRHPCSACGKRFQTSTCLKQHVAHVHMRLPAKPRVRKRRK